jgi:hypothetical protein
VVDRDVIFTSRSSLYVVVKIEESGIRGFAFGLQPAAALRLGFGRGFMLAASAGAPARDGVARLPTALAAPFKD